MKKVYLLATAACVAVSASAVEKDMLMSKQGVVNAKAEKMTVAPVMPKAAKQLSATKENVKKVPVDGEEFVYVRPADAIMSIGFSTNGYGYNNHFGFASPYGNLEFINYSNGVAVNQWSFSDLNDYEIVDNKAVWNVKTSNSVDLSIKSGVGEVNPPVLDVEFKSGGKDSYELSTFAYLCGGGTDYWGLGDDADGGIFGLSFYQNQGLKNPQGYTGSLSHKISYSPGEKGYNANGVYTDKNDPNNWESELKEEFSAQSITNLAIENFTFVQPAPVSTYYMTKAWITANVSATSPTQLISYIYPINEEGQIEEMPIALGYAAIPKGTTRFVVFEYLPLNEDGDELDGDVFIDSAVAITMEGFAGNDAISNINLSSGFYPFSYAAYSTTRDRNLIKSPVTYISFTAEADGKPVSALLYDTGLYYFNQKTLPDGSFEDPDTLSLMAYTTISMNATFPWILPVNGEEKVVFEKTGGKADIDVNALYFNINGMIEDGEYVIEAPEWVGVTFGDSDQQTGNTTMTLNVAASDTDRTGVVKLSGMGVAMEIKVVQGEENAVEIVGVEGTTTYFDLAGRRVMNPDKGVYIKVNGDKAEKVVF